MYSFVLNCRSGGANKMELRENQTNNRPQTKNYIAEKGKKSEKMQNAPPRTIQHKRVWCKFAK